MIPHAKYASVLALVLAGALLSVSSCKKEPTGPEPLPDTTNHAVTWQTYTFGHGGTVWGLSIFGDNNIWAVGEFYLDDSLGQPDPTMYNLMRWDGTKWNPMRLTYTYSGGKIYLGQIYAIYAMGPNEIWLSVGGGPCLWNGQTLQAVDASGVSTWGYVLSIWGTSSSDLYAVGNTGMMVHYDGSGFSSVPTGINSNLWAITGQGSKIYVSSYSYDNQIMPSGIFEYTGGHLNFLFPDPADQSDFRALTNAFAIWLSPQGTLWALGECFVFRPFVSHTPIPGINPERTILRAVTGKADNDVFVAGSAGTALHWNGLTWRTYSSAELGIAGFYTRYHALAVSGSTIAIGGWTDTPSQAIVTVGRRAR